jgi:hypothetical protein
LDQVEQVSLVQTVFSRAPLVRFRHLLAVQLHS